MKKALAIILLLSIVLSCSSSLAADAQLRASELIIDSVIYAFDYGSGNIEFATDMTTLGDVDKLGLGQFTRNYTQTVKRAADNKRRYAPGWVHSTCLLRGFPKGAAPHLAHDFAEQSVVCYTLCRRCPENTVAAGEGKGI